MSTTSRTDTGAAPQKVLPAVAAGYFVASFAALGLPPYLTSVLPTLGDPTARWAGVLYVVPTVFSGAAAPFWGRLADRFGRRRLLLRAQLGLCVAFVVAGCADSVVAFAVALALQGVLGGTFAASNGYLGATLRGADLSRALTVMQGAARAALVAAPIVVGTLSGWVPPHRQYLVLAALPLVAAVVVARLPESRATPDGDRPCVDDSVGAAAPGVPASDVESGVDTLAAVTVRSVCLVEFAFVFATIVSFPYTITAARQLGASPAAAGVLFALPHLVYLASARSVHDPVRSRPRTALTAGFALVAVALALHTVASHVLGLVAVRVLLGIGMTLGLVALAVLASHCAVGDDAGHRFGSIELFSKAGAVAAGLTATVVHAHLGAGATFGVGACAALMTTAALTTTRFVRRL